MCSRNEAESLMRGVSAEKAQQVELDYCHGDSCSGGGPGTAGKFADGGAVHAVLRDVNISGDGLVMAMDIPDQSGAHAQEAAGQHVFLLPSQREFVMLSRVWINGSALNIADGSQKPEDSEAKKNNKKNKSPSQTAEQAVLEVDLAVAALQMSGGSFYHFMIEILARVAPLLQFLTTGLLPNEQTAGPLPQLLLPATCGSTKFAGQVRANGRACCRRSSACLSHHICNTGVVTAPPSTNRVRFPFRTGDGSDGTAAPWAVGQPNRIG
jgi:hypothetical protein